MAQPGLEPETCGIERQSASQLIQLLIPEIKETVIRKKLSSSFKHELPISVPVIGGRIRHRGMHLTNGDIVSLVNAQQKIYPAQIRCLLQDWYLQKSALVAR
ncbi:hypothetical protein CDAR_119191 [Caerostris darwini]|uniref:Uncharacterized protein n=1 Tax=Caerostris darwini TaxID=1538125 RepID=A0AAV4VAN3_9ARAC|nr:hypothetical protein CDAR_119191 [Caerostris darwini]